jgi:hypothetical protein
MKSFIVLLNILTLVSLDQSWGSRQQGEYVDPDSFTPEYQNTLASIFGAVSDVTDNDASKDIITNGLSKLYLIAENQNNELSKNLLGVARSTWENILSLLRYDPAVSTLKCTTRV